MGKERDEQPNILVQAGILAVASIVVRFIGLLYQAPLTAIIGDEGNGYYSLAYNIYTIVLLISSYSIPSAISKIMAERLALHRYKEAQRIFYTSLGYVLVVGTVSSLVLYFGAPFLVSGGAVPVLRVFAPTIFLFGILGVLRGYFQARSSMVQTSVSQILEQIFNAGLSILFAYLLMRFVSGADPTTRAVYGAIGSAMGTGSGVVVALLFMAWVYYLNRPGFLRRIDNDMTGVCMDYPQILSSVIRVVTPFILSSFILNLTTTLNQTIYTRIMTVELDYSEAEITTLYGIFSRKATVITNIPISVATAASAAIIPNIAAAFATGSRRATTERARSAVRVTALLAIPSAVGLAVLAKPITMLLFPQKNSLDLASGLLTALAVSVFFYSLSTVTNAILQSSGHMNLPLVGAGIALTIQTVILIFLLRRTSMGIYALVLVSVLYSLLIFLLNEWFIRRYLGPRANLGREYIPPVLASLVMGLVARAVYEAMYRLFMILIAGAAREEYFANLLAVGFSLLAAVCVYGYVTIRMGTVREKELVAMPGGTRLARILHKLRLFPER